MDVCKPIFPWSALHSATDRARSKPISSCESTMKEIRIRKPGLRTKRHEELQERKEKRTRSSIEFFRHKRSRSSLASLTYQPGSTSTAGEASKFNNLGVGKGRQSAKEPQKTATANVFMQTI
ncbi:hypothetical protein TWF173_008652 [Orbilia oligospora]|nr:hypothetical protein TWF173_008652 [Orbilia oligospora]